MRKINKALRTISLASAAFGLSACMEPSLLPDPDGLPRPSGFAPSVAAEQAARRDGQTLTAEAARRQVDEFDVSSDGTSRNWPIDSITYKAFQNTAFRADYIRKTLGRYALIEAQNRGLGVSLDRVRAVARTSSSNSPAEWWTREVHGGDLLAGEPGRQISLPDTVTATIRYSHQMKAFGDLPAIRGTAIQEAEGRFAPEFFAQASTSRINIAATSPAIAGGNSREIFDEDVGEVGVRSRLTTGGQISISQRFATTNTDRITYIPSEQSTSGMVLAITQPLLRGAGTVNSDIPRRVANFDTQIAVEEFKRQSESHLVEVERAYWNLYVARAVFLQKRRLAARAADIADQIEGRSGIDADALLIGRGRSLAEEWRADMVRAGSALDNAEFRLAALVNDPRFGPGNVELIPASAPNGALSILTTADTIDQIFVNRPELQQAILSYETSLLLEGQAANESLPGLDLVMELTPTGGVAGTSLSDAYRDGRGRDGHLLGLAFAVPIGFDERDARYKRRRIETIQQERQVMSAISTVLLEVDVDANEYIVAAQDLAAQRNSLAAANRELETLQTQWVDGAGQGGIGLLSLLLDSYERVQETEQAVATARATREIAAADLARARGVLLQRWGLRTDVVADVRGEPTYRLVRRR